MQYTFKFYLQMFAGVHCDFLCHSAHLPPVSDFVPNPMKHVHISDRNYFCYPCP